MQTSGTSKEVRPLVEHLFRRESGKLTAALTRFFGSAHLDLAEDVVQDTLLKAMHEWPFKGVPDDPVAWLHRVAKNGAIDRLRRDAKGVEILKANAPLLRSEWSLAITVHDALNEGSITDDQLRMFFACCHPSLPQEQQVALVLKTLCGFSVPEIAHAFVTNEETINKRLYRARESFRAMGELRIPEGPALEERLASVLASIYLLFNEGYKATRHEDLIREDLIEEALRLADLLTRNPSTDRPEVHALLALMIYHAARSEARSDTDGNIILLADQDRSRWDQALIALAAQHLDRATQSGIATSYHLEAAIAGMHAHAPTFAATRWVDIVTLYDRLLLLKPNAIVRMNRAVAVAEAQGADEGLGALEQVHGLEDHHVFQATRGELMRRAGRTEEARTAFQLALSLASTPQERTLLEQRLAAL